MIEPSSYSDTRTKKKRKEKNDINKTIRSLVEMFFLRLSFCFGIGIGSGLDLNILRRKLNFNTKWTFVFDIKSSVERRFCKNDFL